MRETLKDAFRSLRGRDFRLYFIGQVVSLIGTWVQQVALAWITYRVTGSAFMLGLITFSGQIPMLVLTPVGGILADRFDRRKILVATQIVAMATAVWLSLVAYNDGFSPWVLIAASIIVGTVGAAEMPTRQAFLLEIVHDRTHAGNAIALNSLTFNGARLVGPAVSGAVLYAVGETACFVINALSFLAALYTLMAICPRSIPRHAAGRGLLGGVEYLRQFAPARWLLLTVAATSLCIAPFMSLMPVYAKDVFRGGPAMLGTLMGASGFGAVLASLYLATRNSLSGSGQRIAGACFATGVASIGFAYNASFIVAVPLLVVFGAATIIVITSCNMLLQQLVPDHLRGRVMALYTMSFIGVLPLGALLTGSLAHIAGVEPVFAATGLGALVMGAALVRNLPHLREETRRVLAKKGL